jgi:hypothetical protein
MAEDTELKVPLGLALAQMPLEAPDRDVFPLMAAKLQARRRMPRWPMALAASLLLGMLMLPNLPFAPSTPAVDSAAVAPTAAQAQDAKLAALMSESERLERLVFAADAGASSASAAALSAAYEDQLHALDAELAANRDAAKTLPLWQQRVELLRGVAAVETSRHYLASQGGNFDVALVAAY